MAGTYGTPRLPLGVAILAVLVGVIGAFILLAGLVVLVGALLGYAVGAHASFIAVGTFGGLITAIFGLILLAIAFGLWDQELWAFVVALLAVIVYLLFAAGLPLYHGAPVTSILTVPILLGMVVFVYLLAVSEHFY